MRLIRSFWHSPETEQIRRAQDGYTNFYDEDAVNPYVVAAGAGPWLVSLKGAVVYDCGGYGMLGLGHAPDAVLDAMNQPHVMANIMTASVSQMEFISCLKKEIGHTRNSGTPFTSFLCLNSGSEATSMASRIADINTKNMTDPGAPLRRMRRSRHHAARQFSWSHRPPPLVILIRHSATTANIWLPFEIVITC